MISVAMTTYNGEKFIERQLKTILNQTKRPDEIIICDDGSSDHTAEIVQSIAIKNPIIHFEQNKVNLGYIKNFKKAISLTHGDYIFLADQDDEWHTDKIEKLLVLMQTRQCTAICSNFDLIDQDSNPLDRNEYRIHPFIKKVPQNEIRPLPFRTFIYGNVVQGCTYCFTKDVKDYYLHLTDGMVPHDQQIMFTASLLGTVLFDNEKLIDYRLHSSNTMGFGKKEDAKAELEIKKPSRKPFMVVFLDELNHLIPVPHIRWYKLLFYLRIPYLCSKIRKY